jgi:hypothetical protein
LGSIGKNYHIIALVLPVDGGCFPATEPRKSYSLPGYSEIVVFLINYLNLSQLVLVGHILGIHIALEAIDMFTEIKGAFIFGTPPLGIPPAISDAFLTQKFTASLIVKEGAEIPQLFEDDFNATDPKTRIFLMRNTAKNNFKDKIEIVVDLKTPLAAIHGAHDKLINLDYIKKIRIPILWKKEV